MLNPHRERSPESILGEIEHQVDAHPELQRIPTRIWLIGSDLSGHGVGRQTEIRLLKLLRGLVALRRKHPNLTVFTWLSPSQASDEVMRYLNELEAYVQWGFEQWSSIIDKMGKMHQIEHAIYTLKLHDKYPRVLLFDMNMLVGFPGETVQDVHESQVTLQKLRFILARLQGRGWISPIRILLGNNTKLGRSVDAQNPLVREATSNEPMAKLLDHMAVDERPGADLVLEQTMFSQFDTTATASLSEHYVQIFNDSLSTTRLEYFLSAEGGPTLDLVDEYGVLTMKLSPLAAAILQRTEQPVTLADLSANISEYAETDVSASVAELEKADLLYTNAKTGFCINTLPHHIQARLDTLTGIK
jgi:hypothetical protein